MSPPDVNLSPENRIGGLDQPQQPGNVGNLDGQEVQQVDGEPVALQEQDGHGVHVDNVPLQQVQEQLGELDLQQVQGHGQVQGGGVPERVPQLQQQINDRLMTFDSLAGKIGHRPHPDKIYGLWKMSTKYKAVGQSLNLVNKALGDATIGTNARNAEQKEALHQKLGTLVRDAKSYIKQHTGFSHTSSYNKAKIAVMQELLDLANTALAVLDDPDASSLPQDLSLTQALEIKQRGILFSDCDFTHFTDSRLDLTQIDANFGAGNANTVAKLVYGQGDLAQTLIFKPELKVDSNPLLAQKSLGIDLDAPHYGERNIASRAIDQALGSNTVVDSRIVLYNDQVGLLMDKAEGRMPGERAKIPVTPPMQRYIDGLLAGAQPMAKKIESLKATEFVQVNGAWMKIEPRYEDPFQGNPPGSPLKASIQQQLCRLEWSDALAGQFDRHGLNYMISMDRNTNTAVVTGIDNDLAFGKDTRTIPETGPDLLTGYNGIGKPQLIDRTAYDRIHGMDFDNGLLPSLQGRLTEEEISATRERFDLLKNHAESLNEQGKVVDNWETWRSGDGQSVTELLSSQPTDNSYYKRDIHAFAG